MMSRGTQAGRAGRRDVRVRSKRLEQVNPSLLALAAWMAAKEEIERRTDRSLSDDPAAGAVGAGPAGHQPRKAA